MPGSTSHLLPQWARDKWAQKWSRGSECRTASPDPSPSSHRRINLPQRKLAVPDHMMTRWALLVLMVLMLGRVLVVSATPIPAFKLLPQNYPETTPFPVSSKNPSSTTTGPPATWGYLSSGPHLGPRIALSLDVPIGLLQILLEQARTRAAREQAAINARILAHIGRR